MGKTDFSQLSKGMFKKSAQVGEIKPLPKTKAVGGDDVLSFFGLNAPETPTCASVAGSGDGRILALEADVRTVRAESAALEAAKAEAERKAGDLECQLAAERHMREAAEAERERLRGELMRLRNELEDALTAPPAPSVTAARVKEVRVDGLLRMPVTPETFPGEIREHVLAALSEAQEAAESSERERRAAGAAIDFTCGIWDNSPHEVSFEFFDGRLRGVSDGDAGAGVGGFFFSSSARRERC